MNSSMHSRMTVRPQVRPRPVSIMLAGLVFLLVSIFVDGPVAFAQTASTTSIIFSSNRDGDDEIYSMDPDGSNLEQLTFNTSNEFDLACSPDGRRVALVSDRDGNYEIYLFTIATGQWLRLTNDPGMDLTPSWSPDGIRLVFVSRGDGDDEIYVMAADGTGLTRLTDNSYNDFAPEWSPDGTRIVFDSNRSGRQDIWVMDADGANPQQLTDDSYRDFMADWSPDGTMIVYESERGAYLELFTMNADGSNQQRLTYLYSDCHEPDWSPDGSSIVFMANFMGSYEILTIQPDGNGLQRISDHASMDWSPSWRTVMSPYFGYDLPDRTPERFGPDSLLAEDSLFWHGAPVYAPDFQEMQWAGYHIYPHKQGVELFHIEGRRGRWTSMEHPSFADTSYGENNPYYSPGGDTLYFLSHRPNGPFFMTTRTPSGWSEPVPLGVPLPPNMPVGWQFAVAKSGNLYFELWGDGGASPPDLYVSYFIGGQYYSPVSLGGVINSSANEIMPYIEPDERYLLFCSNRPGGHGWHDIYVSFRRQDFTWTEPVNLGQPINSGSEDGYPHISPDGRVMFFNSFRSGDEGYNPYWVGTSVIDSIRATVPAQLQQFAAEYRETGVELSWQVTGLEAGEEFTVQRSRNGDAAYRQLPSADIQKLHNTYFYVDKLIEAGSSYRYRVLIEIKDESRLLFETGPITIPRRDLALYQNYPNPFNPSTVISFYLPATGRVELSVYDPIGRRIRTLASGRMEHGFKEFIWNGTDERDRPVSSGVYFCRLAVDKRVLTRKMILLK